MRLLASIATVLIVGISTAAEPPQPRIAVDGVQAATAPDGTAVVEVRLHLSGEAAQTATAAGQWQVAVATAERAIQVHPEPALRPGEILGVGSGGMVSLLDPTHSRMTRRDDGSLLVRLPFVAAADAPLANLSGHFTLLAGGRHEVVETPWNAPVDDLEHDALKAAGVTLQLRSTRRGDTDMLIIALGGEVARVVDVRLAGAGDAAVQRNIWGHQGVLYGTYHGQIPADARLQVVVAVDQQSLRVPLDIANLAPAVDNAN